MAGAPSATVVADRDLGTDAIEALQGVVEVASTRVDGPHHHDRDVGVESGA